MNAQPQYYYTYTDHLVSILKVTDQSAHTVAEQNFDAWGRKRSPTTLSYNNVPNVPSWLYCGYTAHEHLPEIGLINMNGRMYDPAVGRMLSVDNYTHEGVGLTTQAYNRYSYALNNPLKYTDPSGEEPITISTILIGMAIGGAMHTGIHYISNDFSFSNWNWGSFAGSLVASGVGSIVGPALNAAQIGGFYGGTILGASTGLSSSLTSGLINGNLSLGQLAKSTLFGAGIGGMIGGIEAELRGYRFLDGKSKIIQNRSLLATGNTPKTDNPYYNKYKQYEVNEVNDLSNKLPRTREIEVPKGFVGDLEVSGIAFGQESRAEFYVNIDGETVFRTSTYRQFNFSTTSKSKYIGWGFRGGVFNSNATKLGNNMVDIAVRANPLIKISGPWRGWDGFLFW